MIEPVLSDDAFEADWDAADRDQRALHIWWLGQSGFYVNLNPLLVLFDPYLSDSLTRKYATTGTPHVRMTRRVAAPERFTSTDYVFSSHAHTDHLDGETLNAVLAGSPNATLVYPKAVETVVNERVTVSCKRLAMRGDDAVEWPVRISAVPAAHPALKVDESGSHTFLGYVLRYRGFTLYHSGDTVVYDGMVERLRPFNIDLAILPINGKVGNMSGRDAARLAHDIGAKLVIPCHYEMFQFNTADPRDEFIPECERLGQPYKVLRAGERLTLEAPREGH